jgi:hypothetical protein
MMHYFAFCNWLNSFSILSSKLIHVVALSEILSLYMWKIFQCTYVPHCAYLSICQWTFWFLPHVNYMSEATINIIVQKSLQDSTSNSFIYTQKWNWWSTWSFIFNFLNDHSTFPLTMHRVPISLYPFQHLLFSIFSKKIFNFIHFIY